MLVLVIELEVEAEVVRPSLLELRGGCTAVRLLARMSSLYVDVEDDADDVEDANMLVQEVCIDTVSGLEFQNSS